MVDATASCAGCGVALPPMKSQGNPRKWCSPSCANRIYYANNPDKAEERRAKGRVRSATRAASRPKEPVILTCAQCAGTFEASRRDQKYCGKTCGSLAFHARRVSDGRMDLEYERRESIAAAKRRPCARCGRPLIYAIREVPICAACRSSGGPYPRISPVRKRAERRAEASAQGIPGHVGRLFFYGSCNWCGDKFCGYTYNGEVARYCSDRCKSRAKLEVMALDRAIPGLMRRMVHERDGWVCYLCDFPVNRKVHCPHPEAPVIDHVVALAAGGPHNESNWRTAHFLCNSYKRDLPLHQVINVP